MFLRELKKIIRKQRLKLLSDEVNSILAGSDTRLMLVVAYVFAISMAGLGLILSYLLLNVLEYCSVKITDPIGFLVMFIFVYLFAPPAFAGVRNTASAICDGRAVSLADVFYAFTSFKRWGASYLPIRAFSWIPKYKNGQGKGYGSALFTALKARMSYVRIFRFALDILLSFATCFIYFILVAGPRSAIRSELIVRKINDNNLKNNERTVNRND